ncbi:uncharacterized protein LOC142632895 [Castanea sativa]|uniref:uncharacterized protein LOC142632895 n=1 Tax=Castanea sativa TaxID=21020 RepID=UPI003F6549A1
MGAGETLHNYANRYWELYNEIGWRNEKIAASTLRMGLPEDFGLKESLTKRPPEDMRQLMRRIKKYKRLEDDRLQSKGKAPVINHPQNISFQPRPRKDLRIQEPGPGTREVNVAFKEPCRVLKDHLEQLVKTGHLKEFLAATRNQEAKQVDQLRGNPLPPPLGVIKAIHAVPKGAPTSRTRGILVVVSGESCAGEHFLGKKLRYTKHPIAFDDDDMEGTIQLHGDALVVMTRVRGFIVKRIMID